MCIYPPPTSRFCCQTNYCHFVGNCLISKLANKSKYLLGRKLQREKSILLHANMLNPHQVLQEELERAMHSQPGNSRWCCFPLV